MSSIKREEGEANVAAEEDWKLVVKVEDNPPVDMAKVSAVYVKQEVADMLPEEATGKERR